jgi:hypothetical protein
MTTINKLTRHTPFRLVYGQDAVMPMEFIMLSMCIETITDISDSSIIEERLSQLLQLEEDRFVTVFHQQVQKAREKACHDQHIKKKKFKFGDLVLLYENKFMQHNRNSRKHWLDQMTEIGVAQLETLNGELLGGMVNGSWLKPYKEGQKFAK